jgi:hypothetical protein
MQRLVVVVLMLTGLLAGSPGVRADEVMWRSFRGRVTFSDVALAPDSSFGSTEKMTAALRRIQRSSIDQTAGFWRIHILAFLDRPAPSDVMLLRAFDMTVPREPHEVRVIEPRQVRVFEVPVERGAKELRLEDFVVTEAMGFERGVSYQITIEARPEEGGATTETKKEKAGKADVYAKGVITLR